MESAVTSIQVLLQAAEFLERRERGAAGSRCPPGLAEAEHGYASLCPARPRRPSDTVRSVHNALEKHGSRHVAPGGGGGGVWQPCPLEEQELRARRAKDRLHNRQRSLQQRLEQLLSPGGGGERTRADSLDSYQLSEPSEGEDDEIEVDGAVFGGDLLPSFGTGRDHSYSSPRCLAS
ncbi:MAD3 protein, partial [Semnornis frantzii]|nr:MAD3 protein [Semnornis frantzii]